MFVEFEENNKLFTEAQRSSILFHKVQSSILTQVKNTFQVSYNLDQDKPVTFDFI